MPTSSLTSRLARLASRLGLGSSAQALRQTQERMACLRLPFPALQPPPPSIFWQDALPLQQLHDLPRGALSGPTQEEKARAHAALVTVIERQQCEVDALDLRKVDGVGGSNPQAVPCASFEAYAASPACRAIRIISYKDFNRTINQALPAFAARPMVGLLQASWRDERLFWIGEQQGEAFACAVAYARLRGLDLSTPCRITRYKVNTVRLQMLRSAYHVLLMPAEAWETPELMHHLLEDGTPYVRLRLQKDLPELLLLDRHQPQANALGIGLKRAGAQDFTAFVRKL